nr:hypothetical protein [Tanacetum cinerariifolium]
MNDDTPMCEPHEASYVQGYHRGYHDRKSKISYSNQNHNPNRHYPYPQHSMTHPSQYFKTPETSTKEMMKEWMARQMESTERMKNQVIELERKINQRLRNRQAIIQNLDRQFEYLEKIQQTQSLPHITNNKPKHEFFYKPPSILNENDKGNFAFIEVDKVEPIPTKPNQSPIKSNSQIVSPFLKDCTMHIPYTNAKMFVDTVLPNHVGDKELKYVDGVRNGFLAKNEIKKDEMGMPKEPNKKWKLNEKVVPNNKRVYHYLRHLTKISHLNRIIKES